MTLPRLLLTIHSRVAVSWLSLLAVTGPVDAQSREPTPIRQSDETFESAAARPLTLRDASRNDRWLGAGVRDARWAADGSALYFRWTRTPRPDDLPEADPWFRTSPDGSWVEEVPQSDLDLVPGATISWGVHGRIAVWVRNGSLFLFDGEAVERVVTLERPARTARIAECGSAVHFEAGSALYRYDVATGALAVIAAKHVIEPSEGTDATGWLVEQQREVFEHVRARERQARQRVTLNRSQERAVPQPLPVPAEAEVDQIQLSPDGRFVTFRTRTPDTRRPPTRYVDYVDPSGYATVREARGKVGEPRDELRLGIVAFDPVIDPDSVEIRWVELPEAGDVNTVPHGPFWNLEGTRAVAQLIGEDHRDLWFAEIDPGSGKTAILAHDHDDAWIGGPPIQANYLQPALMEWLPGDRFVFASERSGWSHLYLAEPDGSIRALTEGPWEVRAAELSRDRSQWLLQAGREHPSDDHLYRMPAAGGPLVRLTEASGRHEGRISPDGERLGVLFSSSVQMPDLFVRSATDTDLGTRITASGTDEYYAHPLVAPEIVSFQHPDGDKLWAALFEPDEPDPARPAVIHVHGGGYRQFAHRGWSVYGYALHLGLINYLVQEGYTVLDFDYRGSAGFGRDYRTDIARSMGIKDADGAAAAARFLADERGVQANRIGIYGVSYGGFLTLMSLFRYPGVFPAGIARASVSDWAHYSDLWTSRILGVPHADPEAYRRSSPIYYAEGLQDRLLITHGLVDDNVHFQDSARLIQRLIELEKDFEVMVYPVEPHTIQTEASRYDFVRRATEFFDRWLRGQ